MTHAACWAHGRRALENPLAMEPELAQQGLDYIAALYASERKLRHGTYVVIKQLIHDLQEHQAANAIKPWLQRWISQPEP